MAQPTSSFGADLAVGMVTPQVRTYAPADVQRFSGAVLKGAGVGTQVWTASSTPPASGTFTLTLTSVGPAVASGADTFYPASHGTLDATLPPQTATGAAGTATIHATF